MDAAIAYKPAEAAKLLGVSMPTMYAFLHRQINPCPSFRVGVEGTQLRIPRVGMELWALREAGVNIDEAAAYLRVLHGLDEAGQAE